MDYLKNKPIYQTKITTTLDQNGPNGGVCSKVQRSWDCELPTGEVFTIYDWKEYRTIEEETLVDYHIGGFSREVTIKAKKLLLKSLEKYNG